jgi:hypothetical protein
MEDIKETLKDIGMLVLDEDNIQYMLDNNITPADIGLGNKPKEAEEDDVKAVLDIIFGMTSTSTVNDMLSVLRIWENEAEVCKYISTDVYLDAVNKMEGNY